MKNLYGRETLLAAENFRISGLRFPRVFIEALARVKQMAARANRALGLLDARRARAIERAAAAVATGQHDDQFILDVFQTGSGTSTNMNANEVIASLAGRAIHPNDHVNLGQSSNDVMPSVAHISALLSWRRDLRPALTVLETSLRKKSREFARVIKLGRTHLMDAVPMRLGQEFGGYATQVAKGIRRIDAAARDLEEIALGGTAVGTGLNTHPRFARRVCALLSRELKLSLREARDHFEAQAGRDDLVAFSGALATLAGSLLKIANDLRWMGSGPFGGLGELIIPELQKGSSIMPGKVNPVMGEVVAQVATQVTGLHVAVLMAGQQGAFELNTMIPLIAHDVLESMRLMANATRAFADKCVDGLQADVDRCRALAESTPAIAAKLNPLIGYDRAAKLAKEAVRRRMSVRDLAVESGLMTKAEANRMFGT